MEEGERFVRALVAAVPEGFDGVDVATTYGPAVPNDVDLGRWLSATALEDAARRVEHIVLEYDHARGRARVKPGGDEVLRRFFEFLEGELPGQAHPGWIKVALVDGGLGLMGDIEEFAGPKTLALLQGG